MTPADRRAHFYNTPNTAVAALVIPLKKPKCLAYSWPHDCYLRRRRRVRRPNLTSAEMQQAFATVGCTFSAKHKQVSACMSIDFGVTLDIKL